MYIVHEIEFEKNKQNESNISLSEYANLFFYENEVYKILSIKICQNTFIIKYTYLSYLEMSILINQITFVKETLISQLKWMKEY